MAARKSGDRWVVEFMFRGQRFFRRLPKGRTKADAQALESKLRHQVFDAVDLGKLPDPLLEKLIDEWLGEKVAGRKSERQTADHARAVIRGCEAQRLSQIVEQSVALRHLWRSLAPATINRRLCVLKAVAKYAYQKGYCPENLSAKIQLLPENNARHVYLTQAQIDALIASIPAADTKAFVAIAAYTGLRQGEVMALQPEDVTPEGIVVRDSKNGMPRVVPYLGERRHLKALPMTRHKRTLYAEFEWAAKGLKLPYKLRYHDLRHTTASLLINSGSELYTVGEILGHKSVQTTKRYAHLSVKTKRKALEAAFGKHRSRTQDAASVDKEKRSHAGSSRRTKSR